MIGFFASSKLLGFGGKILFAPSERLVNFSDQFLKNVLFIPINLECIQECDVLFFKGLF